MNFFKFCEINFQIKQLLQGLTRQKCVCLKRKRKPKGKPSKNNSSEDYDCPFHPGKHKWSKCYGNPHGSNYKANFRLRNPGRVTRDAHTNEHVSTNKGKGKQTYKVTTAKATAVKDEEMHFADAVGYNSDSSY